MKGLEGACSLFLRLQFTGGRTSPQFLTVGDIPPIFQGVGRSPLIRRPGMARGPSLIKVCQLHSQDELTQVFNFMEFNFLNHQNKVKDIVIQLEYVEHRAKPLKLESLFFSTSIPERLLSHLNKLSTSPPFNTILPTLLN